MDPQSPSQPPQFSKTNPWMVATLVLVGIIVGFGTSQIPYLKNVSWGGMASIQVEEKAETQKAPARPRPPELTLEQVRNLSDDDPVFGDPKAPITFVEFSDFQCPFCKRFMEQTLPLIEENYIKTGKVKFVYRDFPIESHQQAPGAALAADCANEQNKFREMHDLIFNNQPQWSGNPDAESVIKKYAKQIKLNEKQFDACMSSQKYNAEIRKDLFDGIAFGVTGTPSFFINGKALFLGAVPYETFFKPIFEAELAGKKWEVEEDDFGRAAVKVTP